MRGLIGAARRHAFGRRRALTGLATFTAGTLLPTACAPPTDPSAGTAGDVYVALARSRAIAVLDPVTDREVGRISLESLGSRGHPWRLGVSPAGAAAVMPLSSDPAIGLVTASGPPSGPPRALPSAGGSPTANRHRRCQWVRVDFGRRSPRSGATQTALALTTDAVGHAYVLVGDGSARAPSYAAVVDLQTGNVLRHLHLAGAGESVLALQAAPDGTRLYASVWYWDDSSVWSGFSNARGRLIAVTTSDGTATAQASLPQTSAVTDLSLAAAPDGRTGALYATLATPGPARLDGDGSDYVAVQHGLVALDGKRLSTLQHWPLPHQPTAVAITRDGASAYVLSGSWVGPWSMRLTSLDLASGAPTASWPLPGGCLSLAIAANGRLYVADATGDRLWRVDTATNSFLGSIAQPGAPLSVTARA